DTPAADTKLPEFIPSKVPVVQIPAANVIVDQNPAEAEVKPAEERTEENTTANVESPVIPADLGETSNTSEPLSETASVAISADDPASQTAIPAATPSEPFADNAEPQVTEPAVTETKSLPTETSAAEIQPTIVETPAEDA